MVRVAIVGLGLVGGSIGMALRQANLGFEIVGHDRSPEEGGRAKKLGAVDRSEWSLPNTVENASIVIVAVPVQAIRDVFGHIAPYLAPGTIVTDTGSTKADVMRWADEILPAHVSFVGGHPMAGREKTGVAAASADLLQGATYCLMASAASDPQAIDRVARLVEAIGARPYFLDPEEHDSFVAAVSHLPFVVAAALVNAVSSGVSWRDARRLAAGGFRDTTRVASGDVVMHRDICLTNRTSLLRWLDGYAAALADFREAIERGDETLEELFARAKLARDDWEAEASSPAPPGALPIVEPPSTRQSFGQLFFGRRSGPPGQPPEKR